MSPAATRTGMRRFDVMLEPTKRQVFDAAAIPLTESVEEYMAREVPPYAPDARIEPC